MDKISSELEAMEQLLKKYGDTARANSVSEYSTLLKENETLFWSKVDSLSWWGGSGSMADYYLYGKSDTKPDEQKMDNHRFRAALIAIYQGMVESGRTNERGKFWVEIFDTWQKKEL